jgi:uncharacterized membrane protein
MALDRESARTEALIVAGAVLCGAIVGVLAQLTVELARTRRANRAVLQAAGEQLAEKDAELQEALEEARRWERAAHGEHDRAERALELLDARGAVDAEAAAIADTQARAVERPLWPTRSEFKAPAEPEPAGDAEPEE